VKIDDDVKALASQLTPEREIVSDASPSARTVGDKHAIEMGVALHDGCGGTLHQIPEGCVGVLLPDCGDRRGGKDDVADEAKPNQENLHPPAGLG
jgi:hypothetical protein